MATAATMSVAGLGAAPASSVPSNECPEPFPVADLVRDQPVSGLTVSQGSTPDGFTGEVLGVLENGIMPGLDMVLVRLTSPELERVGGIWSGMSGSPVYAANGQLIGAVAYGLAFGPSTVAGVTPASDMLALLEDEPVPVAEPAEQVAIPDRIAKRLVASGDATADEVESGMSQLRLPFAVAGMTVPKRLAAVADRLDLDNVRVVPAGTSTAAEETPALVAGGNVAATIAHGDITAGAVGTVTAVCGTDVVAFGHPFEWAGPTTLAMHAADAIYVQEDPTLAGFKVANIGAPVGTIDQDRMPGIAGLLGAAPATSDVTSTVSSGSRSRTGTTHVSRPEYVPQMAFSHVLANMDRIFDGIGKGTGTMTWTVDGTRQDGTPFTVTRSDVYASAWDVTFETAWDVAMALERLEYNGVEDISLDAVGVESTLSRSFDKYTLDKLEVRRDGAWVRVGQERALRLKAGSTARLRVHLSSPVTGPRMLEMEMPVPKRALGRFGVLDVFGGGGGMFDEEFYFEDGPFPGEEEVPTVDDILVTLAAEPFNDEVVANLTFFDEMTGTVYKVRHRRASTGQVVTGAFSVGVRAVRR